VTDARDVMHGAMDEAALMDAIIKAARWNGWLVHHDVPAKTAKDKWMTNVRGDTGFPDLVLARGGEVIIVECKAERGRWEPGQREWLAALGARVVRPRDLGSLLARLGRPGVDKSTRLG
jgi:hypothetical protein